MQEMKEWQKKFVTLHLAKLIEKTTINTTIKCILVNEEVLHQVELEQLDAIIEQKGQLAAVQILYTILITRSNGYKMIGKAVFEAKQSGAFLILLTGLLEHLLQQIEVSFSQTELDTILEANWRKDDTLSFFLQKNDSPMLFEEHWIPSGRNGTYIPRYISNRVKVNPTVFKQNCDDMFFFTGLTRSHLSEIAGSNETAVSRDVILKKTTTARFVLLEQSSDWDRLNETTRFVHLIQYERTSNEFILLRSTGSDQLISKHVPFHLRNKSLYISEKQFHLEVGVAGYKNSVCICDSPGMGKTWMLENMARQIHQHRSNQIIAFIRLSEFTQCPQLSSDSSDINSVLSYLTTSSISRTILNKLIHVGKVKLELFLDGFDEIPEKHLLLAKQYFRKISKSNHNIRLFVTSRPHMRKELERLFHAVAYDILPLSEENQIDFLVQFWKTSAKPGVQLQERKLKIFAASCLKVLKRPLKKGEEDMMGIPLQCLLLATVNMKNAELYCSRERMLNPDEFVSTTSMYDMYKVYVEIGLDKALGSPEYSGKTTLLSDKRRLLKAFHVWKALEILYPQLAEDYFKNENISNQNASGEIYACGILQMSSGTDCSNTVPTFLHRTFAEFLVAELFTDIFMSCHSFKNENLLKKFVDVFTQNIFNECFHSDVMMSFLNVGLGKRATISIPKVVAKSCIQNLVERNSHILPWPIQYDRVNILRLIKVFLCQAYEEKAVPHEFVYHDSSYTSFGHKYCCLDYICNATKTSNILLVKEVFNVFEECFGINLDKVCSQIPKRKETPLHLALRLHNYSLIEYFAGRISLPQRGLLYHCVENTDNYTADEIETVIDICKFFLQKDASLLEENGLRTSSRSIFAKHAHLDLIKFFVFQNANTHIVNTDGDSLLVTHYKWMDKATFCELCKFLVTAVQAFHLFLPNIGQWDNPLSTIIYKLDDPTLQQVLQIPGICPDILDYNKNNLILRSIYDGRGLNIVKLLVEKGIDHTRSNAFGKGALHIAVACNKVEFVSYFLSLGHSLNIKDRLGNTPLHDYLDVEMVKYLLSRYANIHAVNNKRENIAHIAADQHYRRRHLKVVSYLATLRNAETLFAAQNVENATPIDILYRKSYFSQMKSNIPNGMDVRAHLNIILQNSGQRKEYCSIM